MTALIGVGTGASVIYMMIAMMISLAIGLMGTAGLAWLFVLWLKIVFGPRYPKKKRAARHYKSDGE